MRVPRLFLAVVFALLPALAQDQKRTDDRIYDQVKTKLMSNRDVKGGGIEVEVKDGVVTLRGKVPEPKNKNKAEQVARKVKGVKKVVNELQTELTGPTK